MKLKERSDRYYSQGRWLAIYSAVSFFCLYFFPFYYEDQLYDNLEHHHELWKDLKIGGEPVIQEVTHYSWYSPGIKKIPLHNLEIEKIEFGYLLAGAAVLVCGAVLIGGWVYVNWLKSESAKPKSKWNWMKRLLVWLLARKRLPGWRTFFIGYGLISIFVGLAHNFMFDFILAAVLYVGLIYIIRGVMRFNPHREINAAGKTKGEVTSGILKLYQQYIFISLAAVGLISTTFLFALQSAFRELYKELAPIFPLIEKPNYMVQIWLTLVGCSGLLIVTREFNMKQREVFAMKLGDAPPDVARVEPSGVLADTEQSPVTSARRIPG